MRDIEIYVKTERNGEIEFERLDLFDNGTIEIKSSIQDAKDISKVFTDYSQPFTIPASDNNNQIFRHHYRTEVTDNIFDGRVRHEAKIFINHLLFKKGKVFLNGTSMKNGKASSYNITFFGNTVSLKDTFKDDKLLDLCRYKKGIDGSDSVLNLSLAADHEFSHDNVKTIFRSEGKEFNGDTSALIYPLITSRKRLFYNESLADNSPENFDGNLYAPTSDIRNLEPSRYNTRGVTEVDLKPALKAYHIIKAIEEKYNINFIPNDSVGTKDFFSKHNEAFANLYLWLSNNSGNITGNLSEDEYIFKTEVPSWSFTGDSNYNSNEVVIDNYFKIAGLEYVDSFLTQNYIKVTPSSGYENASWKVKIINSETNNVFSVIEGTGATSGNGILIPVELSIVDSKPRYIMEFSSKSTMLYTTVALKVVKYMRGGEIRQETYSSGAVLDTDTTTLDVSTHFPDMKVMEFMTGLFKMFNLTAYYIDDESDPLYSDITPVVKVVKLDDYYDDALNNNSGGIIDITKHIDIQEHSVNTSLPFSEIEFKFQENETILMANHLEENGEVFGDSSISVQDTYDGLNLFYGEKYEIDIPFSKLKYERINGLDTDIVWGYAAGGDFKSEDTTPPQANYSAQNVKALLFYGIRHITYTHAINFSGGSGATRCLEYYRPSNTSNTAVVNSEGNWEVPAVQTINFDSEQDEYTLSPSPNSLFKNFYKSYITSVFDANKRVFKLKAYLPPSFLINYKLNDQLKVQDVVYRINSITTNLNTGLSRLELINLNVEEIVE
ncbi:MAG TPA: hypothetical protein DCW83_13220 [Saprospirales bacterium]|nr:hypothetical protein [Saprospirales bacterium]